MPQADRRQFLTFTAAAGGALLFPTSIDAQVQAASSVASTPAPKPSPLPSDQVKEFVVAGHVDLDKVKAMLAQTPSLLNAAWDWGGGDFEMAIGGAGHMGRRDIATFLIGQGGRYDIFVAAMLGRLDLVKATLAADPNLATSKGPHGIPLLVHAKKGGEQAAAVLEFIQSFPPNA